MLDACCFKPVPVTPTQWRGGSLSGLQSKFLLMGRTMELLEGEPLDQLIMRLRPGTLPQPQAIAFIQQMSRALAYAHSEKIVHYEKAILNTARMGYFSSDRTICEYASKIWQVQPVSR